MDRNQLDMIEQLYKEIMRLRAVLEEIAAFEHTLRPVHEWQIAKNALKD